MIKYSDITKSVGEQAVDTVKLVEERLVDGLEAIDPMADQVSSMLPVMPEVKLPLLEAMPSFTEIVEANAALAERLVKANKDFFLAVAKAAPRLEREVAA